ncbi:peptide chain release factor 2 [bacterium]|nr:peptide chain release factor 2 [bacterium]
MNSVADRTEIRSELPSLKKRIDALRGFFDSPSKERRLEELELQSQQPDFWDEPERAQNALQERASCQKAIETVQKLVALYDDIETALELSDDEPELLEEAHTHLEQLQQRLQEEEFYCKMSGEFDQNNAIVEFNGGAGGTESMDWANMLLRMYLRWAEKKGFAAEELEYSPGEEAGIKSATILIKGEYAYGHLRSEQGVHRLVRISPFDSNARRHTSFASVAVTPDIDQDVEVEIDEKDLRIDTYRSSGAGGQHVNKTDSAVRLTHLPTGLVVACQNERSQHKNKDRAMKMLRSKLYELKTREQAEKMDGIKGERKSVDFGSQIRSYVMQPYQMVKDLRTNFESSNVDGILDGDIDPFIESYLLSEQ